MRKNKLTHTQRTCHHNNIILIKSKLSTIISAIVTSTPYIIIITMKIYCILSPFLLIGSVVGFVQPVRKNTFQGISKTIIVSNEEKVSTTIMQGTKKGKLYIALFIFNTFYLKVLY